MIRKGHVVKVLIISGTGWVGHQVAGMLAEAGNTVTVTSRGKSKRFPIASGVSAVKADRSDFDALDRILNERNPQVVIDMIPHASHIKQILDACAAHKIEHYLHCSSTGVYVPLEYVPGDEDHPWDRDTGVNFTGKVNVDRAALEAFEQDGLPVTVIRPSYIQGEGALPLDGLGGRHKEYWQRVAAGEPVAVPNEGQMLLHPVYYKDVASSFVSAIEHRDRSLGQTFIICGDKAVTLGGYVRRVIKGWGSSSQVQCIPAEQFDCDYVENFDRTGLGFRFLCEHMCFTNEKARRLLGWQPKVNLADGLTETVSWSKEIL